MCERCVVEHLSIHQDLHLAPDIRPIEQVNRNYLARIESRAKVMADSSNRKMASNILKGYVDDFYQQLNVDDRVMVSQRGNLRKDDVKSLLQVMLQDNRTTVNSGFRERLHAFLQENLGRPPQADWTLSRMPAQQNPNGYQGNTYRQSTIPSQLATLNTIRSQEDRNSGQLQYQR